MKFIIAIVTFLLCSSFNTYEEPKADGGCLKLEIMILADLSGSIKGYENFIHDAAFAFIDKFELADEGIRIGLVVFRTTAFMHSKLTSDKQELKHSAKVLAPYMADGGTNLLEALQLANNEMMTNGRPDVMKMFIIISDGEPHDANKVFNEAMLIKSMPGNMIWSIFVRKYASDEDDSMMRSFYGYNTIDGAETLKQIASPNCYVESDFNNLVKQIEKLDICL